MQNAMERRHSCLVSLIPEWPGTLRGATTTFMFDNLIVATDETSSTECGVCCGTQNTLELRHLRVAVVKHMKRPVCGAEPPMQCKTQCNYDIHFL